MIDLVQEKPKKNPEIQSLRGNLASLGNHHQAVAGLDIEVVPPWRVEAEVTAILVGPLPENTKRQFAFPSQDLLQKVEIDTRRQRVIRRIPELDFGAPHSCLLYTSPSPRD